MPARYQPVRKRGVVAGGSEVLGEHHGKVTEQILVANIQPRHAVWIPLLHNRIDVEDLAVRVAGHLVERDARGGTHLGEEFFGGEVGIGVHGEHDRR